VRSRKRALPVATDIGERLLRDTPFAVVLYDGAEHRATFSNRKHDEMTAGRVLIGKALVESIPELAGQPVVQALDRVYATGTPESVSAAPAQLLRNGSLVDCWFDVMWQPARDASGQITGVLVTAIEVTEHVLGRQHLEAARTAADAANARFSRLSESGVIGIVVGDLTGRIVEANDTVLALVGYTRDEILSGRVAWTALTPPEWRHVDALAIEQLTATGIGESREKEYIGKDGRRIPVLLGSAMLEREPQLCISFVLDLTERKAVQAANELLRQQSAVDAKFKSLLEAAPDAMVILNIDGTIVLVNGQAEALFGYPRAELIGEPLELLLPERFRTAYRSHRIDFFRTARSRFVGAGQELHARRKDGTEVPIEVSLSPVDTQDGLLVSSAIRDITERQRAERQRAHLAAIVNASDDAIVGKTLDGVITSWNPGAERLFGYSADEIVGKSISLLVPPARATEEAAILDALAHGDVRHFDTVRRRRDGSDVEVSVTISPMRDTNGDVVGISKVARDVTDRRKAEQALRRAKEAADTANRELEAFSYSVAHDLRAPLRGMNGFAHILLEDYGDKLDAQGKDWLREIVINAERMGALIDALLSLSRVTRSRVNRESVDLSAIVRAATARLSATEPDRAVELVIADRVYADLDPALARALLENLVGNAWKFTGKTAAARIEFGVMTSGGRRCFYVRDNGAGFDMAFALKLFAPFQRLHSVDEFPGTGIGLATVQRIVHRHGGQIWAEGTVDGGATFFFTVADESGGGTP
jgi:PAS domain S-box-containing protein